MSRAPINNRYDLNKIDKLLGSLDNDHSSSNLLKLKKELNSFFLDSACKQVLYTINTDKLFFGMRVYVHISKSNSINLIESDKEHVFTEYSVEIDSKLYDPMLGLTDKELTAILLHEIGHIVYDSGNMESIKANIDMYFANNDVYLPRNDTSYKELLAYAIKDSVIKNASLFAKIGNEELVADAYVAGCGYGIYLESAFKKILSNNLYINKSVNNKFVTLAWVLQVATNIGTTRLPAIKTLNKAKQLTASELEKREIENAIRNLNKLDIQENVFGNIKTRFDNKIEAFKLKGIRNIKNDIYELNLRLRSAESESDLLYVIRTCNTNINILQDYLTEDITEEERQSAADAMMELYKIRDKAAKEKGIRDKYSMIQVYYPTIK